MNTPPSAPLLLFGLERSVYTRVARLVLEEKEIPYSLREVEIFSSSGVPEEHFGRHPFGRIPVLKHGDFSLYETSAITRYIDESFSGPALQPRDVQARARMNQVIGILDAYAYRPMVWGVFVQRVLATLDGNTPDEAEIEVSLRSAGTCLRSLSNLLEFAPFLVGQRISLADLHAFPIFRYFCLAPEGYALLQDYPQLLSWYEAMLGRWSICKTTTCYETGES